VGGGGRYDGLAEQLGGRPTPGFGWAAGIERILLSAEQHPQPVAVCDLFVAGTSVAAFALASEARRAGLGVQLELAGRSMKGMLKQAARLDAGYVAVVSDEGIELKDMETGEQEPVESVAAVVARVLRGRHPA
jgi:histidyl-tRNA synthetase